MDASAARRCERRVGPGTTLQGAVEETAESRRPIVGETRALDEAVLPVERDRRREGGTAARLEAEPRDTPGLCLAQYVSEEALRDAAPEMVGVRAHRFHLRDTAAELLQRGHPRKTVADPCRPCGDRG